MSHRWSGWKYQTLMAAEIKNSAHHKHAHAMLRPLWIMLAMLLAYARGWLLNLIAKRPSTLQAPLFPYEVPVAALRASLFLSCTD